MRLISVSGEFVQLLSEELVLVPTVWLHVRQQSWTTNHFDIQTSITNQHIISYHMHTDDIISMYFPLEVHYKTSACSCCSCAAQRLKQWLTTNRANQNFGQSICFSSIISKVLCLKNPLPNLNTWAIGDASWAPTGPQTLEPTTVVSQGALPCPLSSC